MSKKNKNSQEDLIDQILNETKNDTTFSSKGKKGRPKKEYDPQMLDDLNEFSTADLTPELIISGLMKEALKGNVKAYELLGEKLDMFNSKSKQTLVDIFLTEETIEQELLKFLDILEDKYEDISIQPIIEGQFLDLGGRPSHSEEEKISTALEKQKQRLDKNLKIQNQIEHNEALNDQLLASASIPLESTFAAPTDLSPLTTKPVDPFATSQQQQQKDDDQDPLDSLLLRF